MDARLHIVPYVLKWTKPEILLFKDKWLNATVFEVAIAFFKILNCELNWDHLSLV